MSMRSKNIRNFFDENNLQSVDEVQPGMVVKAKITSIKDTQMNVVLGYNLYGRIHITGKTYFEYLLIGITNTKQR